MKNILLRSIITVAIIGLAHQALAQHPKEAVCAVCRVHEGTTEPEKVVAFSEYQGATHYFCSQKCKETFESDPEAYLPPVLPRPAWEVYRVKVIPMMFLVDPKGQIIKQWVGETDMKEVENAIGGFFGKSEQD